MDSGNRELTELKKLISSLLISSPLAMNMFKLDRDYAEQIGERIPFRKFGYSTLESFLQSMPDVVQVQGSGANAIVKVFVSEKVAHIDKLIAHQRIPITKRSSFGRRPKQPSQRRNHTRSSFIPRFNTPRYEMSPESAGTSSGFDSLPSQYVPQTTSTSTYSPRLPQSTPLPTSNKPRSTPQSPTYPPPLLSLNIKPPDSLISPNRTNVPVRQQCDSNVREASSNNFRNENNGDSISNIRESPSNNFRNQKYSINNSVIDDNNMLSSDEEDFTNYNVPYVVQENLKLMIAKYDDGLFCLKIPDAYRKMFKKELDYKEYGYKSLILMCLQLKNVFHVYQPDKGDCKVYSKAKPLPLNYDKGLKSSESQEFRLSMHQSQASALAALPEDLSYLSLASDDYPEDIVQLYENIPREFIPDDMKVGDYIEVCVGEIYDPSKFWIILKSRYNDLEELMDDMQLFYINCDEKLHIPENRLERGLYCAAKYNREFHRAIIVDTDPNKHEVKVFYIDYGTVSTIKSAGLCFLHQNFVYLSQQAIRARLASIYPVESKTQWAETASARFLSLVKMKDLVARLYKIDYEQEIVEIILVDTNGDDDIYINDTLVNEGYALFTNQKQKEVTLHPECIPCVKFIHLYPTFNEIEQVLVPSIIDTQLRLKTGLSLYYCYQHYFVPLNERQVSPIAGSREITSTPAHSPRVENEPKIKNNDALSKNSQSSPLISPRSNSTEESNNKRDTVLNEPIKRRCCYLVNHDTSKPNATESEVLENRANSTASSHNQEFVTAPSSNNSNTTQHRTSKPPPGFENCTPVAPLLVNSQPCNPFIIQTPSIQNQVQQTAMINGFQSANMLPLQHINAVQQQYSLSSSNNYYVNQNLINPFGAAQTQTSPNSSKLELYRQIMIFSLKERNPFMIKFIELILTHRGTVQQKQLFDNFKQNLMSLDAASIEIFLNSVFVNAKENYIMEICCWILESKQNNKRSIIQGELNGHVICYIRYENKVYVLVDELCELINVKIPIERVRKLMVLSDSQYRIVDIRLNDNVTLKEEISRFRNLDSTSIIHVISLEYIAKMIHILTNGEVRLNNFDSVIFKYHSNSDVWTKN